MKKFDVVDLMARSYRIPKSGLTIRDPDSVLYPLKDISSRIYNYSDDKRFFLFATEYETFICPFFFGIEYLLTKNGFEKVNHSVINVNFGPNMCPRNQNDLEPWLSNFNAIREYCFEVTREIIEREQKSFFIAPAPPHILEEAKKIPADGIFLEELKEKFYPIICKDFPYLNNSELRGSFAYKEDVDAHTITYIIYASDAEVYVTKLPFDGYKLAKELNARGYMHRKKLFIPDFEKI